MKILQLEREGYPKISIEKDVYDNMLLIIGDHVAFTAKTAEDRAKLNSGIKQWKREGYMEVVNV